MALTDTEVRNAKPTDKAYKLTHAQGLFLLVATTGNRLWRMDYRYAEKRKTLSMGAYLRRTAIDHKGFKTRCGPAQNGRNEPQHVGKFGAHSA